MSARLRMPIPSRRFLACAAACALLCGCEPSATAVALEGIARVIDGDSIELGAAEIRLLGVDAPEGRQTCRRNGGAWRWGEVAATHLRALVGAGSIACSQRDIDRSGRIGAVCTRGAVDVGRERVRSGLALAYRQYSRDYVDEEDAARAARRGIWSSEFEAPWDWRQSAEGRATNGQRANGRDATSPSSNLSAPQRANADCRIKGNISRDGDRIYHVPGSRSYEETVIDATRGERWFCTAEEAQRAGWRAPRG
jgi:endonuclease YncB( thermonuclease family)